jgi:hypothetical protein
MHFMSPRAFLVLWMLLAGCGGPEPAGPPSDPTYRDAEALGPTTSSEHDPYCDEEGCCPVWLSEYGTEDEVEEVVAFYEGEGFEQRGTAGEVDDRVVRWVGIRPGDRVSWRRADVFAGFVADLDSHPTVIRLAAPDCA